MHDGRRCYRRRIIMTFVLLATTTALLRRAGSGGGVGSGRRQTTTTMFAQAFVFPVLSGRRSFGTGKDKDKRVVRGAAGLRRTRPKKSGTPLMEYIEEMQRTKGMYKEFRYGMLIDDQEPSAGVTALSASTTAAEQEQEQLKKESSETSMLGQFKHQRSEQELAAPRMRFAPSPTGSLHVGGARTALYNWLVAQKGQVQFGKVPPHGAAFVLRVEDTDLARSTKESERSVLSDLQWLGLLWDEGPVDAETLRDNGYGAEGSINPGPYGPYRQSERGGLYKEAATRLLNDKKAYRCFCTPEELDEMKLQQQEAGEVARYDGRWRDADPELVQKNLDQGKPYTVRFRVPDNTRVVINDIVRGTVSWDAAATVGDFILLRSSGVPVYNFCVAVDDACMGITTVVRAEEHLTNTLRQALILDALGAPRPNYAHCSLILGSDKQKLSKRHGATSCRQYQLDGYLPDAMINYLALLGWNDGGEEEIFSRDELIDAFDLERVVKSPSVFDLEKLKWVNQQHLKGMSVDDLVPLVVEQMGWNGMLMPGAVDDSKDDVKELAAAMTALTKDRMETTKDTVTNAKTVLDYGLPESFDALDDGSEAKQMIRQGNFYVLATRLVQDYRAGNFPQPDPANPGAAFAQDLASGPELEDSQQQPCEFTASYMSYMKGLAKELNCKGKKLFHPVRLALTGEMSGQDVTKQLSLLSMVHGNTNDIVDVSKFSVVSLEERMERLEAFCKTIPEEYQTPATAAAASTKSEQDQSAAQTDASSSSSAGAAAQSTSSIQRDDDPKDTYDGPPVSALDIRVGRITKIWEHEEADKLYCEEIDLGEPDGPRRIASGLRPYFPDPSVLEGRLVLVVANLKARKLVGFPSHGMVLCASNADHTQVKLINPPVDAVVGERVTIPDVMHESADHQDNTPMKENALQKKKILDKILPHLKTDEHGTPKFLGRPFLTTAGVCTSPIPDGSVG